MRTTKVSRVRTSNGLCLGEPVAIGGKVGVHMVQGGKEEDILPEDFAEYVTGRKVVRIVYSDERPEGI